jgi:hypothetical protein
MELTLILEAEGHEGKLYLVDSGPDFFKAMATQGMGSNEEDYQTSLILRFFTLIAPHEATSAAVSKVYHWRNVKLMYMEVLMYSHLNVSHSLTLGSLSIQIPNSAAGLVIIMLCLTLCRP